MSKILLMKRVNRGNNLDEITAHESARDLAEHLWGKQMNSIEWILKLDGVLMYAGDIKSVCVPELAKEVAAFKQHKEEVPLQEYGKEPR